MRVILSFGLVKAIYPKWKRREYCKIPVLAIDCTLEITEGSAKVFWISGSDEAVTLIEATGTYSDTITPVSYTHLDVYKRQV